MRRIGAVAGWTPMLTRLPMIRRMPITRGPLSALGPLLFLLAALALLVPSLLGAQTSFEDEPTPFYAGGSLVVTQPEGAFGNYVGNGFGGSGHLLYQPDGTGIFALRMDLGFVSRSGCRARRTTAPGSDGAGPARI
jgi:hypothetical protein